MGTVKRASSSSDSLIEVAETWRRRGRLVEARQSFLDAAAAADQSGDKQSLVVTTLGAGGLWVNEVRDVVERARFQTLWERALEVVAPGSLEEARLLVRTTAEAVYHGDPIEPVVAAVEVVRAFRDDGAVAEALANLHHVLLGPEHAHDRLELARELITSAVRAKDSLLALMGLCWRTVDLFLLGDSRARQSLTELRERSVAADCLAISFVAELLDAMLLARAGKLEQAEHAAAFALEQGTSAGDPDAPAYHGAMIAALRWWQGRAGEILDLVRTISASPRLRLNDPPTSQLDDAVANLQSALRVDRRLGSRPLATLTEHALGEALKARAAPGDAELGDELERRAQEPAQRVGLILPEHPAWLCTRRRQSDPNPTHHAVIERVGTGRWRIEVDGGNTLLDDRVGISYLAQLLRKPGQDIDVLLLATNSQIARELDVPILDGEALRRYRQRVRELRSLLERGAASGEEANRCRDELRTLTEGLRSVTRLHGRSRNFVGSHERARTAVRKAIVRAIETIASAEPDLGDLLAKSISTGASCRYTPDPHWSVTAEDQH
ncbi:MAG: hypothetical protein ABSD97_11015 [Acidimicrobiales bacterium]|jgi:hypothetical protein